MLHASVTSFTLSSQILKWCLPSCLPHSLWYKGPRFHLITFWFSVKLGWVTLLHIAIQNLLIFFSFFFLTRLLLKVNVLSFYFHRLDVRGHNINRSLSSLLPFRNRLSNPFRNYNLQQKDMHSRLTLKKKTEQKLIFLILCFEFGLFRLTKEALLASLP